MMFPWLVCCWSDTAHLNVENNKYIIIYIHHNAAQKPCSIQMFGWPTFETPKLLFVWIFWEKTTKTANPMAGWFLYVSKYFTHMPPQKREQENSSMASNYLLHPITHTIQKMLHQMCAFREVSSLTNTWHDSFGRFLPPFPGSHEFILMTTKTAATCQDTTKPLTTWLPKNTLIKCSRITLG